MLLARSRPVAAAVGNPLVRAAERDRCARFAHPIDAARHATGRVLARRAAGHWLRMPPEGIDIRSAAGGRPRLVIDAAGATPPQLSIAHAGEVVLVALCTQQCGIDVEIIDAVAAVASSSTVFSPGELAVLDGLAESGHPAGPRDRFAPSAHRRVLAARWWTAKEAVLKAVGIGLGIAPDTVDARGDVVRLGGTAWQLRPVEVPVGHVATLALPAGPDPRIEWLPA